jgi:hypothetical protein
MPHEDLRIGYSTAWGIALIVNRQSQGYRFDISRPILREDPN